MRADGQEVGAGEFLDFADIAEAGAHDFGVVAELLVVGVDFFHGEHAGVLGGGVILAGALLVPVHDAADEGGDELGLGLGAGDGLGQREEQGEIAVDAFALEDFGGADAFPGGGDLDEDAFARNALGFVKLDEKAAFGNERLGVERQVRVGLGGDAAGDDFEDLRAEEDEQVVEDAVQEVVAGGLGLVVGDGLVDEELVFRHLRGLEDKGGIGRGIPGGVLLEGGEIAGIGDNDGVLLQLFQLVGGAHLKSKISVAMLVAIAPQHASKTAGWQINWSGRSVPG